MNTHGKNRQSKRGLYIALAIALLACLWIGWSDFDPNIAQETIRENIRSGIRGLVQLSVQYLIPIAILVFFTSEIFERIPSGQDRDGTQQSH